MKSIVLDESTKRELLKYIVPALKGNDYLMQGIKHTNLSTDKKQDLLEVVEGHTLALTQLQRLLETSTPPDKSGIPILRMAVKN